MPRYLTKSKFKLGMQCPTKLYYTDKRDLYVNNGFDDPFLKQLAIGGFQVGELARQYYSGGEHILSQNYSAAIEVTNEFLKRDQITIFEAAFEYENFFIRADIVVKNGNQLDLIEVKAKSCDFSNESGVQTKNGKGILKDWREAIEDVAFQKHVIQKACPKLDVRAHLMLADKNVVAATDGLNQKFRAAFDTTGTRYIEIKGEITPEDLAVRLLRVINVDSSCDLVFHDEYATLSFEAYIDWLGKSYAEDKKISSAPAAICKTCEFRSTEKSGDELLCGYRECWSNELEWQGSDFCEPNILDVWNLDSRKIPKLFEDKKIKFSQLTYEDVSPQASKSPYEVARRWRQIDKWQKKDNSPFVDIESLRAEFAKWTFPLHFIDFETCTPVIPFKAGRRPYEGIAFQFSHHVIDADGKVEHAGQFLETSPGAFPNFDFVRELRRQLEQDEGTIFRYHNHENSFLTTIYDQMKRYPAEIPDRDDLCAFIQTISHASGSYVKAGGDDWCGARDMVDMFQLVIRYYYDPAMGSSNSIKKVLPATLNNSQFLKTKYGSPIYGAADGIRSLNFLEGKAWVDFDETGAVIDPYHSLSGVFEGIDLSSNDLDALLSGIDDVNDGGAAMAAYGKLQYEDMSDLERERLNVALLKYCELDTLAMVMIYEAWKAVL